MTLYDAQGTFHVFRERSVRGSAVLRPDSYGEKKEEAYEAMVLVRLIDCQKYCVLKSSH